MLNDINTINMLDGESKLYEKIYENSTIFVEDQKNATLKRKLSINSRKIKPQHSVDVKVSFNKSILDGTVSDLNHS